MKEYKKVIIPYSDLERVVEELIKANARGELIYCEFAGVNLYSDTVTMDSAFLAVTGFNKADFDKEEEKSHREYLEKRQKEKEMLQTKIPEWIERGKKIIYPEKYKEWEECVETSVNSSYKGMDLDAALEIMEALETGITIEKAKEMFAKQGHSGASELIVSGIIFDFSKRGPEFMEAIINGPIDEETKQEIENKKRENEGLELINNAFASKISKWVERGKKIIFPERYEEWEECVKIRAKDLYNGMDLDASLEIMEALEAGVEIEKAKEIFDKQNHSGFSASMVRNIVFNFSKRGPEFWEATAYGSIDEETRKTLEEKKRENSELLNKTKQEENLDKTKIIKAVDVFMRGQNIIYSDLYEAWAERVKNSFNDLYEGADVEAALEIMEALEAGVEIEKAKEIFDRQNHSGWSAASVRNIIFNFSKRGPEFWEATTYGTINEETRQILEAKKRENAEKEKNNSDSKKTNI